MAAGTLALAAALGACKPREEDVLTDSTYRADWAPPSDPDVRIVYGAAGISFVEIVKKHRRAVVNIRTTGNVAGGPASIYPGAEADRSLGSGFIVDRNGFVVTNDHIVANAPELRVVYFSVEGDPVEVPAQLIGRDPKLDVAVLKIDADPGLQPILPGTAGELEVGEWVVALGNPFGYEVTASAGIVSSRGITSRDSAVAGRSLRSFIHIDGAIHAANSGGPLLDMGGNVVGLSSASDVAGGAIGFAAPWDRIENILPIIRKGERVARGWLGAYIQPVTGEEAALVGLPEPQGALITGVVNGSPAFKAGLERGDVVLRAGAGDDPKNWRPVNERTLPMLISDAGAGRKLTFVIWRDEGQRSVIVTTEAAPGME